MNDVDNDRDDAPRSARPTYDETEVSNDVLKDANSTPAELDRSAFSPRGRVEKMGRGLVAGMVIAAGFMGFIVYSMANSADKSKAAKPDDSTFVLSDDNAERSARQAAAVVVQTDDARNPYALQPPGSQQVVGTDPFGNPIMAPNGGQDLSAGAVVPAPNGQPQGQYSQAQNARLQRMERARQAAAQAEAREQARQDAMRRAPVMALSQSNAGQANAGGGNGQSFGGLTIGGEQAQGGPGGQGAAAPANALASRLNGMEIPTVNAGRLPNRNFLVTAGSQIPCVLQTAMDSTQPGLTSCIVPQDIWSANGNVILMEKGTRVLGEYQGGFSTGEHRIFVLWNRAVTPSGVSVSLGSPAADALGRSGMGGQVENFFWQRFGGALLLSIVGDVGSAVSDRVSGVDQTTQAPNSAAAVAAQDSQRVKPRLRAPQGAEMTIMVARDVDFSNVYSLRLRR